MAEFTHCLGSQFSRMASGPTSGPQGDAKSPRKMGEFIGNQWGFNGLFIMAILKGNPPSSMELDDFPYDFINRESYLKGGYGGWMWIKSADLVDWDED